VSLVKQCLAFSGLFEAEVLIELMLRYWAHPFADDEDFRNQLLEGAAAVLRNCTSGQETMEDIPPEQMNFIAAVWYVEWNALASGEDDPEGLRQRWLERVRKAIPSCFCPPGNLP
jgi:hypothetical protein